MATFTVIGEPLLDTEPAAHRIAARDLAHALNLTAPRAWNAQLLVAPDSPIDTNVFSGLTVTQMTQRAAALPYLWRTSASARPRTGELHHAFTPLAPLRSRATPEHTQISVQVPSALAWMAPETLSPSSLRHIRAFTKRALKHADIVLAPTHAVAHALMSEYGNEFPIQVLPLAAPTEFGPPADPEAAQRRRAVLGLPERYLVTTAPPGDTGRLEWVFDALEAEEAAPLLVIIGGPHLIDIPEALRDRVQVLSPESLSDVGVLISGATLFVCPQRFAGTGYELLGALSAGVPVLHSDCAVAVEIVLDAGKVANNAEDFAAGLSELVNDQASLDTLAILAQDRGRSFTWNNTAMQLWELHANL